VNTLADGAEFDAIVVGSGPGGATVARELSGRGRRVLLLERGGHGPRRESLRSFASVLNAVSVGNGLLMGRAFATGGTTAVYLAVADPPPLDTYRALGIDLSAAFADARRDLPLAELPDRLLGPASIRLRASATALGYEWRTAPMLVDQSRCTDGYCYEAKWTARRYVDDAVARGATLVTRARVLRVLVDRGRAVGVEYQLRRSRRDGEVRRAYGSRIVLAAGGAASPVLLRRSGLRSIASRGFFCHPNFMVVGTVSGLPAGHGFGGTMGAVIDGDIHVGDGNFTGTFHRMIMLANRRWIRALRPSATIGVGVMLTDGSGGRLDEDGRYHKALTAADRMKLSKGEAVARRLIEHAGGRRLFTTSLSAAHLGGAVRINEHVDTNLETEYRNLHVCDGSVIPETGYGVQTPTLAVVCLGKYLAHRLSAAL
jgi:choline dehydrogenase-like flavoprotein